MRIKFFAIAALALALASCSGKDAGHTEKAEKADNAEAVAGASHLNNSDILLLSNDNQLRPDTKIEKLTIIDFNASWCIPCKKFAPVFEEAASKFKGEAEFYSVDIDENPLTASAFTVTAVPTIVLMRPDGQTVRYEGISDILPAENFMKIVKDNL